jgi:4-alpha-glucanotransferase
VAEFLYFCDREAWWLDDYAMFMAIKQLNGMRSWLDWDKPLRMHETEAINSFAIEHDEEIRFIKFVQFHFQRQWLVLRAHANSRGVRVIGDIPIFVAEDSADVWANKRQFKVDAEGRASAVAGVPPDPFSATGQIWGNPLYDWHAMRGDDFLWWRQRIRRTIQLVDIVRIDHFRGFAAAWVVPAGADTAAEGHWERSPGGHVFAAIQRELGDVPVIIEDLGVITPDVVSLREILGFPGMNVLQFAFENDPTNVYLPHNYRPHSVVYTATHDNQTTVGWFASRSNEERLAIQSYLGRDGADIAWDLIRVALSSIANTAIIAMQDILRLDDAARMNTPGLAHGNWSWRCREDQLTSDLANGLKTLTWLYGRSEHDKQSQRTNPWDYTSPESVHRALEL